MATAGPWSSRICKVAVSDDVAAVVVGSTLVNVERMVKTRFSGSLATAEASANDSSGGKEFVATWDEGGVELEMIADNTATGQEYLWTAYANKEVRAFRVAPRGVDSTEFSLLFTGYVESIEPVSERTEITKYRVKIKKTGVLLRQETDGEDIIVVGFTDSYEDADGWTSSSGTADVPSQWDVAELGAVSPSVVRQANPTADTPPNPLTTTGAYCRRTNTTNFGTSYLLVFGLASSVDSGLYVALDSSNTITLQAYLRCNVYSTPSGSDMSSLCCKMNLNTRDGYYLGIGNESGTFGLHWRLINGASTSYTLITAITNGYWYGVRLVCYQSGTSDVLEAYLEDPAEGGSWSLEDTKTITAADPLKRAWGTADDRVGWYGAGQFVNNYIDAFSVVLS